MSRKNFKVATAEDGKTTLVKIEKTNVPTGKIKTIKDKEALRKEREEQYKNFRLNALTRRAKRLKKTDEEIEALKKKLLEQLDTPNSYDVLIMFNPNNKALIAEALKNEGIVANILTSSYGYIVADQETLKTLREILPTGTNIHPYVKKKPPILEPMPKKEATKKPLTKAQKKALALAAKKARKAKKIELHLNRKAASAANKEIKNKAARKVAKFKKLLEKKAKKAALKASNSSSGSTTQETKKKSSKTVKMASTSVSKVPMKKAA